MKQQKVFKNKCPGYLKLFLLKIYCSLKLTLIEAMLTYTKSNVTLTGEISDC